MKKRILIMIVVLSAVLFQKQIIAQENINYKFDDRSIANLVLGIESGNYGLQKSCIYLAGKYKLNNLVDELIRTIKVTDNSDLKILTALALHEIGDLRGKKALINFFKNEDDERVKRVYVKVCKEWKGWNEAAVIQLKN